MDYMLEVKKDLRNKMLRVLDETEEMMTMKEIEDFLEEEYGLGDQAYEFVTGII